MPVGIVKNKVYLCGSFHKPGYKVPSDEESAVIFQTVVCLEVLY